MNGVPGITGSLTSPMVPAYVLVVAMLAVGVLAAAISRSRVVAARVRTWAVAAVVLLAALALGGRVGGVVLATVLALVAGWEAGRLVRLALPDRIVLAGVLTAAPGLTAAIGLRGACACVLVVPVVAALPALLAGDTGDGVRRASAVTFCAVWIGAGTVPIVLLDPDRVLAVCIAVAVADVAAWTAGHTLGRRTRAGRATWLAGRLSTVSPRKTRAGVLGAALGAALVLGLLGRLDLMSWVAVLVGGVAGDLLESLVKRGAGVKDAGRWVPGFGGLLDRVDSLLVALPVAALPVLIGVIR